MSPEDRLLTVQKVASFLDVSEDTVRRLIDEGKLTAHRVGRQIRVDWGSVKEYLKENTVK